MVSINKVYNSIWIALSIGVISALYIFVLPFLNISHAEIAPFMRFSGKIVDKTTGVNISDGSPACVLAGVDTCDIRISIFSDLTGGTALWSEVHSNIEIGDNDGIFSLEIKSICQDFVSDWDGAGDLCAISGGGVVFGSDSTLYLQIELDTTGTGVFSGPEVFTRSLIDSVPYAIHTYSADNLINYTSAIIFNDLYTGDIPLSDAINFALPGSEVSILGALNTVYNSGTAWTKSGTYIFPGSLSDTVGIGTNTPGQTLSVAGTLGIREGGSTPTYYTIFQGGIQGEDITYTLPTMSIDGILTNTEGILSWEASVDSLFTDSGAYTYLTSTTDNLSIGGTTDPGEKLEVVGNIISKGTSWKIVTHGNTGIYYSMTYGNGLFVAVAYNATNQILTSPDGINWTARVAPSTDYWWGVTYGNGLFVAVASSGSSVMTSPDGINWTLRSIAHIGTGIYWRDVAYGNGMFVAVATSGTPTTMSSPDGINWTARSGAAGYSIVYGNGRFVTVGSTNVYTSTDGVNWTSNSPPSGAWYGVTYGNGLFVAVARTGTVNKVMTSPDGAVWTPRTTPADDNQWSDVAYGNGLFVAISYSGSVPSNQLMTSPDGINWTIRTSSSVLHNWTAIAYGNGIFITTSGNDAMISGKMEQNIVPTNNIYQGGMVVNGLNSLGQALTLSGSLGIRESGLNPTYYTIFQGGDQSADITYTLPTVSINGVLTNTGGVLSWSSTTVVSLFTDIGSVTYLTDTADNMSIGGTVDPGEKLEVVGNIISKGTAWTIRTSSADYSWNNVAYGNGLFVAVSSGGAMTSSDGINWTNRTGAMSANSITYGNGLFIAMTTNNVMTSPDGINWTLRSVPAGYWRGTYGDGLFVAVTSGGLANGVMTSKDGINWVIGVCPAGTWATITYGNGMFVALPGNGSGSTSAMISFDGVNWILSTVATVNNWTSITYGNGLFVAVAYDGTGNRIMTSPDGVNWTSQAAPVSNAWRSVTYGNGLFVAVSTNGTGNRVITSPDGINWTVRTNPADNLWYGVTYGNGVFVAVASSGTGNRVMTSGKTDQSLVLSNNIFQGGVTVNGVNNNGHALTISGLLGVRETGSTPTFYTIFQGGDQSADITYTLPTTSVNGVLTNTGGVLSWGSASLISLFTDAGSFTYLTSTTDNFSIGGNTDPGEKLEVVGNIISKGTAWIIRTSAADNTWNDVAYGNGLFVAIGGSGTGNRVMISPDGINWTLRITPNDVQFYSVTYGKGIFVAVG